MKRVGAVVLALLYCGLSQAANLSPRALDQIPLHVVPEGAVQRVLDSNSLPSRNAPVTLAINVPMRLSISDGDWEVDGEFSYWRVRVASVGATLLIAHFDEFVLPTGGQMTFSDFNGDTVQGPYTEATGSNNSLWTAMVPGEGALIEVRVPTASRDQFQLRLADLGHGVFPIRAEGAVQARSGGCNIDVACNMSDPWRDQVRSVVRLQIPSANPAFTGLCSGQLINNTAQDDTPYVLTANHCGIVAPGFLNSGTAGGVIAYFNFETSDCGGAANGELEQNVSGATLIFSHERSDHTLIELSNQPPAAFNVYYTGFDATAGATPSSGVGIHHPAGHEKRISFFSDAQRPSQDICLAADGLPDPGCLRGALIQGYSVTWNQGITEPGSSGSGLWNQNKRIVAVLSGGASRCDNPATGANEFSAGPDLYGRLDLAWDNGLAAYLDPIGAGRSIAGKFAGQIVPIPTPTPVPTPTPTPPTPTPTPPAPTPTPAPASGGGGGALGGGLVVAMLLAGWLRRVRRTD